MILLPRLTSLVFFTEYNRAASDNTNMLPKVLCVITGKFAVVDKFVDPWHTIMYSVG